jgi:adenylosuccinate lyase
MIARYTRSKMGKIWSDENKFAKLLEVETAVAKAQAELKIIPMAAARAIQQKGKFQIARILEIEKTTKHDVIAFVSNVAENVGEHGKYIHYGMTSSDVLDTALSLQVREAGDELEVGFASLKKALEQKITRHAKTLCAGRTHGMHAEVTSFGIKMAGFLAELERAHARYLEALREMMIGKLSGAVGTYSSQDVKVEELVCKKLKLKPETIATQVIPRDRHAALLTSLALVGTFIERLSTELRHLQRTEVGEVTEKFSSGQKGSSAMPHKKNPISAENLTGSARLLRSYALAGLENVALWHERDISHSSVERVIFPDAFILADYALNRLADLVSGLEVNSKRMLENMQQSQGTLFSSLLLLALVRKGLTREEAYKIVQENAHGLKPKENLLASVSRDSRVKELLSKKELQAVFSEKSLGEKFVKITKRVL